jgi:SAM-dependent methyltransferase
LAEFTGERLIPGEVDVDLLNEHMARYTFAARLSRGKRVLDAGCGVGYGSAALAEVAETVTGVDVAADAVEFARANYQLPNLAFEQASVTQLPFEDGRFDLIAAFEVIEHLEDWRSFLNEASRVLAPGGQLIVSTPNKLYYTESRGVHGPNPFHVHEFEFEEFGAELKTVFPYVSLFLENHVEGVAFQPFETGHTVEARVDACEPVPAESHFFVAVCARRPQVGNPTYVYVPRAANVLREREKHIAALEGELATKDKWLNQAQLDLAEFDREHQKLLTMFRAQKDELERSNKWAEELTAELNAKMTRITELQGELERDQEAARRMADGYRNKVAALELENQEKTRWAIDTEKRLTAEIEHQTGELQKAVAALEQTESELQQRTQWATQLDEEKRRVEEQLALVRASRWVRLGRKVGVGPAL